MALVEQKTLMQASAVFISTLQRGLLSVEHLRSDYFIIRDYFLANSILMMRNEDYKFKTRENEFYDLFYAT